MGWLMEAVPLLPTDTAAAEWCWSWLASSRSCSHIAMQHLCTAASPAGGMLVAAAAAAAAAHGSTQAQDHHEQGLWLPGAAAGSGTRSASSFKESEG
jgi:hypothetical protein